MTHEHWEQMLEDVTRRAPEEACGLLAGLGNSILAVIPVNNMLHSPVRYRMDPQEQLNAFQSIEASNWELLGIYHSHPHGPEGLSLTDIDEAYYPDSALLIWSGRSGAWECRGFQLYNDKEVRGIHLRIRSASDVNSS
jgi:proteasome lid subunit RPN8/RPN11